MALHKQRAARVKVADVDRAQTKPPLLRQHHPIGLKYGGVVQAPCRVGSHMQGGGDIPPCICSTRSGAPPGI